MLTTQLLLPQRPCDQGTGRHLNHPRFPSPVTSLTSTLVLERLPCKTPGATLRNTWGYLAKHLGLPCETPGATLQNTWGYLAKHLGLPCETPGATLQNTWGYLAKHLGLPCKTPGATLQNTWGYLAKHLGLPCKTLGATLQNTWGYLARHLGLPCKTHGATLQDTWGYLAKHLGLPCKTPGATLQDTWGRYHGSRRPSSDDSFHSPTIIPPSALDKTSIMKRYHRRRTCSHTSPRRSPTMVTLHDTRFVECRWWNDGWTVKTVVT